MRSKRKSRSAYVTFHPSYHGDLCVLSFPLGLLVKACLTLDEPEGSLCFLYSLPPQGSGFSSQLPGAPQGPSEKKNWLGRTGVWAQREIWSLQVSCCLSSAAGSGGHRPPAPFASCLLPASCCADCARARRASVCPVLTGCCVLIQSVVLGATCPSCGGTWGRCEVRGPG